MTRLAAIDALHQRTGIYTREHVVDALLARITWPSGVLRLLDPACGDGAFLERALFRIVRDAAAPLTPADLAQRIEGWEIHPEAAADARLRVAAALRRAGWRRHAAHAAAAFIIVNRDFLTEGPPDSRRYDVVLANPPYLRMSRVPGMLRDEYRAIVPLRAREDLLHAFIDRCAELVHDRGALALVTADRWLSNDRAAALREHVGRRFAIAHVEAFDAESAFYSPKTRRAGTPPRCHPVGIILGPTGSKLSSIAIHPGRIAPVAVDGRTLDDIAHVRIAPWLGTRGIFVVDEQTAETLPADALIPVVGPKELRGGVLRASTRFAIRTTLDVEPPAPIRDHLLRQAARMCARGRARLARWVPPESIDTISMDAPMLVVPRIERSLRAVRVPAGFLPIDHNLCVVSAGASSLDEIEQLLSSSAARAWVAARADRLERGYLSIKTRLLQQLPVGWLAAAAPDSSPSAA